MDPTLTLTPIGYLRTRQQVKFQAGHQPVTAAETTNRLELRAGENFEAALRDLAGFDRIWLISWFHRNEHWRPTALPPRGPAVRRGVFATRSPHRPNPLGLTAVSLLGIEGRTLHLGPCDLVDGTPILDLKPYVPAYDAFPGSKAGWIDALDAEFAAPPAHPVRWSPLAREQVEWLRSEWQVDFSARLEELLARDPTPHRTRRIRKRPDGRHVIECGPWRGNFLLVEGAVELISLEPGYPAARLARPGHESIADREAQLAFYARWSPAD